METIKSETRITDDGMYVLYGKNGLDIEVEGEYILLMDHNMDFPDHWIIRFQPNDSGHNACFEDREIELSIAAKLPNISAALKSRGILK